MPKKEITRALCVWEFIGQKVTDSSMNYISLSSEEIAALRKKIAEGKKEEK